jgi:hypothetical protein
VMPRSVTYGYQRCCRIPLYGNQGTAFGGAHPPQQHIIRWSDRKPRHCARPSGRARSRPPVGRPTATDTARRRRVAHQRTVIVVVSVAFGHARRAVTVELTTGEVSLSATSGRFQGRRTVLLSASPSNRSNRAAFGLTDGPYQSEVTPLTERT